MSSPPCPTVRHRPADRRFELQIDGLEAFLAYTHEHDRILLDHTFVPEALRGRGLAAVLVRAALTEARRQGWRIVPRCSYVAEFLRRHPEFADLTHGDPATRG